MKLIPTEKLTVCVFAYPPDGQFAGFLKKEMGKVFGNVDGIPFQAGYTIGFEIVQAYLAAHPDQPPQVWSRLDPTEILSGSGYEPESNTGTSE